MIRSDINSPDYLEVKDSSSLKQFGERFLVTPGLPAELNLREFMDLLPSVVLAGKKAVVESKTLDGISTKFHYMCKV